MVDADREPPPRPEYAWNGQDMAFLRRFKNLRKVELRALWLRTGVFDVIGDLSQLEILSFRSCDLPSGEELPSLGRLQKLRILTFSGSPTPILDLEWMSDMESLEEFTLASCDRVDESMLRTLAKLPRLKILRLGGGILTKDAASAFGVFPSLRVLNLSGAKMELESLDQLVVPQNLEWLEIDGVQFRPLDSWDEYFEKLGELMKTLPHGCKILLDQQAYQQSQPRLSPNVIYRLTDKPRDEPNEDIMFPDGY